MRMLRFALVVSAALVASSAFAQDWSKEEIAAGVKLQEYTRFVHAGKQKTLDSLYYMDLDCKLVEDSEPVITKEPEHGNATIEIIEKNPAYAKENPRSKCNEKKFPIPHIVYKAWVGYSGTDSFEV